MFSLIYTGTCWRPLCTAIVRPMNSGRIVERRDQVLIGFLSLPATAVSTFLMRWASTNGPFLIERGIVFASYLRLRRWTIILFVRLLRRVLKPFECVPHGLTGSRASPVRPSPPPCGLSTGFMRSDEHTSELQSLFRLSYAVFCL